MGYDRRAFAAGLASLPLLLGGGLRATTCSAARRRGRSPRSRREARCSGHADKNRVERHRRQLYNSLGHYAFGGKATREHRIRLRSQRSERLQFPAWQQRLVLQAGDFVPYQQLATLQLHDLEMVEPVHLSSARCSDYLGIAGGALTTVRD